MELNLVLSFLTASFLLALMPGPDNIFVLTESITKGKRNGIAISIGLCSGVIIHTLAAATGLSLIIQNSAIAFQIIKYLGAAYLLYLAFLTLKEKKSEIIFNKEKSDFNFWKLVRQGFLMNVLNPKVSLFFIAFLPQFISTDGLNVTIQMMVLGVVFMMISLFTFVMISILSGQLSSFLNNDKFWKYTKYGKAIVLGVLGIALAFSER